MHFGTVDVWYTKRFLLVHQAAFWHNGIIHGHFWHVWYSRYVWYTTCIWYIWCLEH